MQFQAMILLIDSLHHPKSFPKTIFYLFRQEHTLSLLNFPQISKERFLSYKIYLHDLWQNYVMNSKYFERSANQKHGILFQGPITHSKRVLMDPIQSFLSIYRNQKVSYFNQYPKTKHPSSKYQPLLLSDKVSNQTRHSYSIHSNQKEVSFYPIDLFMKVYHYLQIQ